MVSLSEIPPLHREGVEAMKIQEWFSDLNETNIERTVNLIFASQYSKQRDLAPILVNELIKIVPLRSDLTALVQMLKLLKSRQAQTNAIGTIFSTIMMSSLALEIEYDIHGIVPYLFFLKKLITEKVIEIWDLVVQIKRFIRNKPNFQFLCFCYFAPEILVSDKEYYAELKANALKDKVTELILTQYQEGWAGLEANNFKILKELTEFGFTKSSAEYLIATDNVKALDEYLKSNKLDFTYRIPENAFTPVQFIQWSPQVAEYAAFYGSVECVKLMLSRGANSTTLSAYAVAGGSQKMIDFVTRSGISFKGTLRLATYYRRIELYNYILPRSKKEQLAKEVNYAMVRAAESNDIRLFRQTLTDGGRINFYDENKESPLLIAAKKGNAELVKYILTFPNVKTDAANCWGKTAAELAPRTMEQLFAKK